MYTKVSLDVDIYDLTEHMSSRELTEFVAEQLANGYIPDGWIRRGGIDLSDGATLLQVIVELRRLGYTVEPGGK